MKSNREAPKESLPYRLFDNGGASCALKMLAKVEVVIFRSESRLRSRASNSMYTLLVEFLTLALDFASSPF